MASVPSPNTTSKLFLVVAVALGVLSTLLAFAFINSASGGGTGRVVRILVATRELAVNAPIDPSRDLKVTPIPESFAALAQLTLDPGALETYRGLRVNRPIPAGQPVFLADIGTAVEFSLSPGRVALPIQAEPGIAVPGDYVKILISRPDLTVAATGGDPSRAPYVANFAAEGQAFRVIAIGGSLHRTRSQMLVESGSAGGGVKWVTLETSEAQARDIQGAIGGGLQRATLIIVAPEAASDRGDVSP